MRHIRVDSADELKVRILKGVDKLNEAPVVSAGTGSTSDWSDV